MLHWHMIGSSSCHHPLQVRGIPLHSTTRRHVCPHSPLRRVWRDMTHARTSTCWHWSTLRVHWCLACNLLVVNHIVGWLHAWTIMRWYIIWARRIWTVDIHALSTHAARNLCTDLRRLSSPSLRYTIAFPVIK